MFLRDSAIARFTSAMLISLAITSATFLPFLLQGALASPPQPHPKPDPQAHDQAPISGYYPEPEPCHGDCTGIHDPSMFYEDGVYWRFSTSGNISVASALSLSGPWHYRGALLSDGTSIFIREDQDIWAPSISKRDDVFYCHYSVSYIYSQHSEIGVATSTSLEPGTWKDHGAIGLPQNSRYNLIDPYVFQEQADSPYYFTFGSYWSGIQQVEMHDHQDLIAWGGQANDITNIVGNTTVNQAVVEGASMHKFGGFYYILFSVGQCCRTEKDLVPPGDEYHVAVCRSDSITGPYFDQQGKNCLTESGGTTILASHGDIYAPGGQGIMEHPETGKMVLYYHYGKCT
ncbi:glycoside hydrolase family 43 protein [Cucurbitaria berberidis CBS 394.84]|uniref:Arabinan endo-1,5-alpha-L-arabinosidase n=1 Tax=Cucurbitaria berberidis CBS 394.84 TaxID=1168544 RepID=A0A9P4GSH5_9PLEO|nr:glycoside hydrolase family 43 protein [Cucurbitaria berberidis CBS 394.84]KAF1850525.1 glycoside hydrolase family 43 protein [Cucurbitaria berberidis CBS 394.84]